MAAPTVQTIEAEAITNTEAVLRGYCWDVGLAEGGFVILGCGEVEDYSQWSKWGDWQVVWSSDTPSYRVWKATGLSPNTLYYFGIVSKDVGGENQNFGGYKQFKTRTTAPVGVAGHYWVEGDYWCYLDDGGYRRKLKGEG